MAKRRIVYRDYRPGKAGQFTSLRAYNASKKSGGYRIKREYVKVYDISTLDQLAEYEDDDNLELEEFHGTADT